MGAPRRLASSAIIERKAAPLTVPPEVPPKFVEKLLSTSKNLGGVGFAFRGNSSIPRYREPAAPKPSSCKGKISNNGAAQGYLVVDSEVLGRVEKDGSIRVHGPKDIPKDTKGKVALPQIQGEQTLRFFMEGLNSKPPKFRLMDGEIAADGKLRLQAVSEHKHVNATVFTIDLLTDYRAPFPDVKPTDISSVPEVKLVQPAWWKPWFGEWEKQLSDNYLVYYQATPDSAVKPMMVYALLDQNQKPLPIVGDQDLLWITIPKELSDQLPPDAKQVINTFKMEKDGTPSGMIEMMEALVKVGRDLEKITGIPPLFNDVDEIPNKVAGYGCMTPLEAYVAIMVNKDFGIDVAHIMDLIQHGAENRNPGPPSDLNGDINHIGIDAKGRNFVVQTKDEKQLVQFVLNTRGFIENNVFDVHKGWDMALWAPVVERQKAIKGYPIPPETLAAYERYKETHSFQAIAVKTGEANPKITAEHLRNLEEVCQQNGWKFENGKVKLPNANASISVKENGLEARESSAEVVNAMAKIFKAVFPAQSFSIMTKDDKAKIKLDDQLSKPDITSSPKPR